MSTECQLSLKVDAVDWTEINVQWPVIVMNRMKLQFRRRISEWEISAPCWPWYCKNRLVHSQAGCCTKWPNVSLVL